MSLQFRKVPSLYSSQQVEAYLRRIGFPVEPAPTDASAVDFVPPASLPPPTLKTLSFIMLLHLTSFPFENTSIHYEPDHVVDISSTRVYNRMVRAHKGGYCMQHATLLLNILRKLGYNAFSVGGHVYPPGESSPSSSSSALPPGLHIPNSHMVIIVSLPCHLETPSSSFSSTRQNALYLVDTGFGADNIMRPLLVRDGHIEEGRGGEQHRLIRVRNKNGALVQADESDDSTSAPELEGDWAVPRNLWVLQKRERASQDHYKAWRNVYVFSPLELGQHDYEAINYLLCRKEGGVFVDNIMISQTALHDEHIDASWTPNADRGQHPDLYPVDPRRLDLHAVLNDRYSVRSGTELQRIDVLPSMATEEERICVLAGVFGLLGSVAPSNDSHDADGVVARDRRHSRRSGKKAPLAEFPAHEVWAQTARFEIRGRVTEIGREPQSL